ncbi:MAG: exodeoxyribonuclease 7 large subunit [Melioribacteraceae bacterium]|nr:MAG: exodeoxyribonuclease 7 large subunit [Melioribacteraceae bacterium]
MAKLLVHKVSEITTQIKYMLEDNFADIMVEGEISNFVAHGSGHWYFTLKDSNAQISCTMWKGLNSYVFFTPEDGMKVIVRGRITVYPPRGNYQLDVKSMKPSGVGELQAAFERLKRKLSDEGLFDDRYKKPLPRFPNKIGIVTASTAAAFKDMISVATRRFPLVELVIYPTRVQGEGAAEDIVDSIRKFNKRKDIDFLIVGRGGGSLEDLWCFNEEKVARAIFQSKLPIISGVGHEIDFTIADFVADLRAPTPSAAMELATPDISDLIAFIDEFSYNSNRAISKKISDTSREIKIAAESYGFRNVANKISNGYQTLDGLSYKIENNTKSALKDVRNNLSNLERTIKGFDISGTLKRGFSIVRQNGISVGKGREFNPEENFNIQFYDKEIEINRNGK